MTLDEIIDTWESDGFKGVETTIELEKLQLEVPKLHSKYLRLLADRRRAFFKKDKDLKRLFATKYRYFSGKMTKEELALYGWETFLEKILKSELDKHIEADPDIVTLETEWEELRNSVKTLEEIIKDQINWRTQQIRTKLDLARFNAGLS